MEGIMKPARKMQVKIPPPFEGVQTIAFSGQSSREDVELFKEVLDEQLKPSGNIERAIFDLSEVDPIMNAAGRILDLACYYRKECGIPIEVRMPTDIYSALHEITPHEMPRPPIEQAEVRGVTVVVVAKSEDASDNETLLRQDKPAYSLPDEPTVVLSCGGMVRAVDGSVVSVSLFIDGEEVIGDFDRSQFPRTVNPGMVFDYQALVTAPGKTEISIDSLTEQQPTNDELEELAKEVAHDIGLKKWRLRAKE